MALNVDDEPQQTVTVDIEKLKEKVIPPSVLQKSLPKVKPQFP